MRGNQTGAYCKQSRQEVTKTPKLAANELEVGGTEEKVKGDINTVCEIQVMKMAWSLLTTVTPKGPKQKQRKPLLKIISFVCMQISHAQ